MKSVALVCGVIAMLSLSGCASKKPAPVVDRSDRSDRGASPATSPSTLERRAAAQGHYIVREGDNLYRIALDHGHDYRDLARWNQIDDPTRIKVGQEIRVVPPEDEAQALAVTRPIGVAPQIESRPLDGNTETIKKTPKAGRMPYSDAAYAEAVQPVEAIPRVEATAEPKVLAASKGNGVQWAWPATGKLVGQFVESGSKGIDIAGRSGDPVLAAAEGKVVYTGTGLRGYGQLVIVKHDVTYLTAYAHNSKILVKEGQMVPRGQKIAEMGDSGADQVKLHFEIRRQGKPVDPLAHLPPR